MRPVKVYLTNAYVDLFKLHTSSTITSSVRYQRQVIILELVIPTRFKLVISYNIQYKCIKSLCYETKLPCLSKVSFAKSIYK